MEAIFTTILTEKTKEYLENKLEFDGELLNFELIVVDSEKFPMFGPRGADRSYRNVLYRFCQTRKADFKFHTDGHYD